KDISCKFVWFRGSFLLQRLLEKLSNYHTPTNYLIISAYNQSQSFNIKLVLLFEYARRESFFRVFIKNRHYLLGDDWSTIKCLVNKMDRATRPLDAVFKHLFVGIASGKCRQKTGVNIQDAITVSLDEITR